MTTTYDPTPGALYATCKTCGIDLPDEEAATRHRSETLRPVSEGATTARGHTTRLLNPTRTTRVRRAVVRTLEEAVQGDADLDLQTMTFTLSDEAAEDAANALLQEVEAGRYSAREVDAVLTGYSDFEDAWREASDWETRTADDPPADHPTLPLDEIEGGTQ